ncbi:amidohydrolase family protein [Catalinimonas locisalis]|uniref:amidohydrolase family protein n=1 Tax=Catalinimonas locisalis TaxID=3133978 RepID=UPI00403F07CF
MIKIIDFAKTLEPETRAKNKNGRSVKSLYYQYCFCFIENIKNTLETCKLADLVVIDQNNIKIKPANIRQVKVLMTVASGKVNYKYEGGK